MALRTTCDNSFAWRSMTAATKASLLGKYWYSEPMLTPAMAAILLVLARRNRPSPKRERSLRAAHRRSDAIALRGRFSGFVAGFQAMGSLLKMRVHIVSDCLYSAHGETERRGTGDGRNREAENPRRAKRVGGEAARCKSPAPELVELDEHGERPWSSNERHRQQRLTVTAPPRRQKSRTKLGRSLSRHARQCHARLCAGGFQRRHHRAAHPVAAPFFVVNEPEAIRHIVLDNAANYAKTEVGRRVRAGPRRALAGEGETWKRHRRIMAPSFDPARHRGLRANHDRRHRGAAGEMGCAAGAARSRRCGGDDARDLAHKSRAMFSSESDEIVDVVEAGVNLYQSKVRPSLPDLLHLPEMARLLVRAVSHRHLQ